MEPGHNATVATRVNTESITRDEVLSLIDRLVDKGLALWEEGGRYRLLHTVRQYAGDRLAGTTEGEGIQCRHFAHYSEFGKDTENKVRGPDQHEWLPIFDDEYDNLRVALDHGFAHQEHAPEAMEMTFNVTPYWFIRGHFDEAVSYYEKALEACPREPSDLRARLLRRAGMMCTYSRDDRAGTFLEQALEMAKQVGSPSTLADAFFSLGGYFNFKNRLDDSVPLLERSLGMFRVLGDPYGEGFALSILGDIAQIRGDLDKSLGLFNEALDVRRRTKDDRGVGAALVSLGRIHLDQGLRESARSYLA
ncbi:MAG: hypothetical protein QOJ65_1339, partial [Fimbriimonadaceae bacterium]|nr:hypothetical protein [Fimbriimonadaceae bacterium]